MDNSGKPNNSRGSYSARSGKGVQNGDSHSALPEVFRREADVLYFGDYPQTIKAADVNISKITNSRGHYLGYDGEYYAKVVATPHDDDYKFSTGTEIKRGATYYFKVEPIRWRILSESNGVALVVCDDLIANRRFDADSNDYTKSEIRVWLNREFYMSAFDTVQRGLIETSYMENDRFSITRDSVFLLSKQEAEDKEYGFDRTQSRVCKVSDYTRATGAWMDTDEDCYGNGWWWLRSACLDTDDAKFVDVDGAVFDNGCLVNSDMTAIRPALRVKLRY